VGKTFSTEKISPPPRIWAHNLLYSCICVYLNRYGSDDAEFDEANEEEIEMKKMREKGLTKENHLDTDSSDNESRYDSDASSVESNQSKTNQSSRDDDGGSDSGSSKQSGESKDKESDISGSEDEEESKKSNIAGLKGENDSDESSIGSAHNEIDFSKDAVGKKIVKAAIARNSTGLRVHVSFPFKSDKVDYHVVTLGNFRNTFYNHADFGRTALAETWTSSVFAKAVPMWIQSIDHVKLRIEYGENAHLKLKNGKTIDRWTFVLPNLRENKHKLSHEVVGTVNLMKKLYSDRKKNPPGELCLNFIENSYPGLYDWLMKNKGTSREEVQKTINAELIDCWKGTIIYDYDNHLDRFMTDNDIKQFLVNYMDATCWEDVSEETKEHCYKGYKKNKRLPLWDNIQMTRSY